MEHPVAGFDTGTGGQRTSERPTQPTDDAGRVAGGFPAYRDLDRWFRYERKSSVLLNQLMMPVE
jgi:hypothetical protein